MSIDNTIPATNVIPPPGPTATARGEFPFVEWKNDNLNGRKYLDYLRYRIPQILEAADQLVQAGWTVYPTSHGIGFEGPRGFDDDVDEDNVEDDVEDDDFDDGDPKRHLKEVGIDDETYMYPPSRSPKEVLEARHEMMDRVWYRRSFCYDLQTNPPDVIAGVLKSRQRVEQTYGRETLGPLSDFDWGMISGKLSTLRWIDGEPWDSLYI